MTAGPRHLTCDCSNKPSPPARGGRGCERERAGEVGDEEGVIVRRNDTSPSRASRGPLPLPATRGEGQGTPTPKASHLAAQHDVEDRGRAVLDRVQPCLQRAEQ